MTSPSSADLHAEFQHALAAAITRGRAPAAVTHLGPQTLTAITRVAREHPEATAGHIASAYDIFRNEHG